MQIEQILTAFTPVIVRILYLIIRHRANKPLMRISELYELLMNLRSDFDCTRILIFRTSNSGGTLDVHTNLYISVIHEATDAAEKLKPNVQRLLVDENFIQQLIKLIEVKEMTIEPGSLMPESLMKDFLISQNVKKTDLILLKHTKNAVYFAQFFFRTERGLFDDDRQRLKAKIGINKLREIFVNAK